LKKASTKHIQIKDITSSTVVIVSLTVALLAFTVVTSKYLLDMSVYQANVISKKNDVNKILEENVKSVNVIVAEFEAFDSTPESIIGTNDPNSKVILDALPSKYDFPALISSIQNVASGRSYTIESISGTDAELTIEQAPSGDPVVVPIPLTISVRGDYDGVKQFIRDLELTIRPIKIQKLTVSGSGSGLAVSVQAETYFQPGKNFTVSQEQIR
jgi:Tfp pilus assembly protein PilO